MQILVAEQLHCFVCYLSLVHWIDVYVFFSFFFLFMYLVYDFNNKYIHCGVLVQQAVEFPGDWDGWST